MPFHFSIVLASAILLSPISHPRHSILLGFLFDIFLNFNISNQHIRYLLLLWAYFVCFLFYGWEIIFCCYAETVHVLQAF